jgi:hypothetical protein
VRYDIHIYDIRQQRVNAAHTTLFLKVCCQTCIKINKTMILHNYNMTVISSIMYFNCVVQLRRIWHGSHPQGVCESEVKNCCFNGALLELQ